MGWCALALGVALLPRSAAATTITCPILGTLFCEDFDGYQSFPDQHPIGDPVNLGIPEIAEGADEFWYGGRFEQPESGTIDQDLAVQQIGGAGNPTPVGRSEDEAALMFKIPAGYTSIVWHFEWRSFSAGTGDRVVAGYYIGDDLGFDTGPNRFRDFFGDDFGGNQAAVVAWWQTDWSEVVRAQDNTMFHSEAINIVNPTNDAVWFAFWMDNGEGDFAKIDNVYVTGIPAAPEPSAVLLLCLGALAAAASRRSR